MGKALDLRIQKTHKALIDAFLRLLEMKRFESITVNELCDAAMVRRATFYKHFADKYEFFSFLVQHMQRDFQERVLPPECEEVSIAPYIQMVRVALDFLDENETLVRSAMRSNAYPILLDIISEQVARDVKERLCEDERRGKRLLLAPELMAQAYTGSLNHIARWWVDHRDQITKEEIIAQITTVFEKLYAASE